jgi:hypothetical protein
MDPAKAGEAIRAGSRNLAGPPSPDLAGPAPRDLAGPLPRQALTMTVADAAAKTGLALRDAESGLTWLSKEYRGQLRVTAGGDLVHVFPHGFQKPWIVEDASRKARKAVGRALMGALRFVVRAWVATVLVAYAAIFVALVIGLAFARQGNSSDSRRDDSGFPGGEIAYAFMRVVGDALFWTFHPWSPFSVYYGPAWGEPAYGAYGPYASGYPAPSRARRANREAKVPFYERVNRFFFGPTAAPEDPLENERLIVAAIRAGKGRIGLADVMRVTGLPRDQADPLMAKLMLDYEGDVDVSEDGGIVYRFAALRKTAEAPTEKEPAPAWSRLKPLPPLTGNSGGANFVIAGLNAFNLLMGAWAIANNMTIERVSHLFDRVPHVIPYTGFPIALGVVPLVFSALLFLLPLGRAAARPLAAQKASEEKGRLAVLRVVLDRVRSKERVTDAAVADAWQRATGQPAGEKKLNRELVALGGSVDIEPAGTTRWRFADLETEAAAVEAEREAAAEEEARLGQVVFATDKS